MNSIEVLNSSRLARIAFDSVKKYLDDEKKKLLARLLSETKVGPLDPQIYAKYLGGISALEELEFTIKREILKGEKIETELLDEQQSGSRY